ncbi:tandem-95 repeat protein [Halobacteriovorax sp. JY17]|uniref:tandem-95 repeat protein n=1 Tax=Halobacteriovorax sp. JY17 TaxID=2014617 RepID=UPI000C4E448A|nr:tandem-95 repeat protein [Halobacteriovorax sp. JY17]PIK15680.1 MAG: hypothetical protein CES88_02840 [Halobacteriovorax sp. JY17]
MRLLIKKYILNALTISSFVGSSAVLYKVVSTKSTKNEVSQSRTNYSFNKGGENKYRPIEKSLKTKKEVKSNDSIPKKIATKKRESRKDRRAFSETSEQALGYYNTQGRINSILNSSSSDIYLPDDSFSLVENSENTRTPSSEKSAQDGVYTYNSSGFQSDDETSKVENKNSDSTNSTSVSNSSGSNTPSKRELITGKIPALLGSISYKSFSLFFNEAYASTCINPTIEIFDIKTMTVVADNPLNRENLPSSTEFNFDPNELNLNLETPTRYLLRTTGCTMNYQRIVTSFFEDQELGPATTLLSQVLRTSLSVDIDKLDADSLHEVSLKIAEKESITDSPEEVYNKISGDSSIVLATKKAFEGEDLFLLINSAPEISSINVDLEVLEGSNYTYTVNSTHWNSSYNIAYQWKLNGSTVSNSASWVYSPPANSLREVEVELIIGKKESSTPNVDTNFPNHSIKYQVNVQDNVLATPVDFALNVASTTPTTTRNIQLDLSTGTDLGSGAFQNCLSFTNMAITEDNQIPSSGDFNISCNSANFQIYPYTIQKSTDGNVDLKLWAIDINGTISDPKILTVNIDTTAPILAFDNLPPTFIAESTVNISWKASEEHNDGTKNFIVEFFNGSAWSNIASIASPSGLISEQTFTTSFTLPNISVTNAKFRVSFEDELGSNRILESGDLVIDAPILNFSNTTYALANTLNTSNGSASTTTITNSGGAASTTCSGASLSGTNASEFEIIADGCGSTNLAPSSSCTIDVRPRPTTKGVKTANLTWSCGSNSTSTALSFTSLNNTPSKASDSASSLSEDSTHNFTIPAAIDADSDSLTYTIVSGPTSGALTNCLNSDTDLDCTYTPNTNFNGSDSFSYKANDASADSLVTTVTLTINPVNDAPTLTATQTVSTNEDTSLDFDLNSGSDVDGDTLNFIIVSAPSAGTLSCDGGISPACTYLPANDDVSSYTFTYRVSDSILNSSISTVTINISAQNDAPVVAADQVFTPVEDTPLNFTITSAADIDLPVQTLSYKVINSVTNGTLTNCITSAGFTTDLSCTYTPDSDFNGSDSFTYRVYDSIAESANVATITFNTSAVNDAPTLAATQAISTDEDTPVTFDLNLGSDIDSATLSYIKVSDPAQGTLSCVGGTSRSCTYTPAANDYGVRTFTYKVNDGTLDSNTSTVSITINSINDAPEMIANQSETTNEDTPLSITLLGASDDLTATPSIQYQIVSAPQNGVLSNCIDNSSWSTDKSCTYTPAGNYNGTDSFTYKAYDSLLESSTTSTVNITISPVNDAPTIATTGAVTTAEDTPLTFDLPLGSDIDSATLTYVKLTDPATGTLTCDGGTSRSCLFTPSLNFNGSTSFTFKVNDGALDSNTSTVTVTISAENDAPVMAADQNVSTDDNTNLVINLSAATDIDGDTLSYKLVSAPTNGSLTNCITTGSYSTDIVCDYISNSNYNGTDSFTFIASDGTTDAASFATVNIAVSDKTAPAAPTISLAHSTYRNTLNQNLTASSCADMPYLFITEGAKPSSGDTGWQACSTVVGAITHTLVSTTEGDRSLKVWSKDVNENVSSSEDTVIVHYDETLPIINFAAIPTKKGNTSIDIDFDLTELNSTSTNDFTIEFFNGSSWQTVGTLASASGNLSATAFSKNWTLPTIDTTSAKFKVSYTDLAGNTAETESSTFHVDSTAPILSINFKEAYKSGIAEDFSWKLTEVNPGAAGGNFTLRFYDGSSWNNLTSVLSSSVSQVNSEYTGSFTTGVDTPNAKLEVSFTDEVGFTTTVEKDIIIDGTAPTISSFDLAEGLATTDNNNVLVEFSATDTTSNITYACLRYDDDTPPTSLDDECWTTLPAGLRSTSVTATPSDNLYFRIGFLNSSYDVYLWLADAAENITTNAATLSVDKDTITYMPGTPPQISDLTVSNSDSPSSPAVVSDLIFGAGSDIYIKWKASDAEGLIANPISISYATNANPDEFLPLASNIANIANTGCTISGNETGCVVLEGQVPTTGSFKIRIIVKDTASAETFLTSSPLNETNFRMIAGNTEKGVGGSSQSVIYKTRSSQHLADSNSLAVTSKGDIFMLDTQAGLLWVNPTTGVVSELIAKTGTASGDGGSIASATLKDPQAIALDHSNGLLVLDNNSFRRIDMNTNPWTISTLIGGGSSSDPGNSVDPDQIKIDATHTHYSTITTLPNGDIYFKSDSSSNKKWRHYDASAGKVNLVNVSGTGYYTDAAGPLSVQPTYNLAMTYDPLSSEIEHMQVTIYKSVPGNTRRYPTRLDFVNGSPTTDYQAIAPYDVYGGYFAVYKSGQNGLLYAVTQLKRELVVYNAAANTWSKILGTGSTPGAPCSDGTNATSCSVSIEAMFVDANGKLFFNDQGLIRTLDDSGNIVTLTGQFPSSGDGGNALSARIGLSYQIDWGLNSAQKDILLIGDTISGDYREFQIGGNINYVAGSYGYTTYSFTSDPINGNIYDDTGSGVQLFTRASGLWSKVIGNGGTSYYNPASDGKVGNDISFDWYSEQILGLAGDQLMVQKSRWNGTTSSDAYIKLYDRADSYRQSHFMGQPDTDRGSIEAAGTNTADSRAPTYGGMVNAQYDATHGWLMKQANSSRIIKTTQGGVIAEYTTLPSSAYGFVMRRDGAEEKIYYCNSSGVMIEYNKTTDTTTSLDLASTALKCYSGQRKILYNSVSNSIYFIVYQNGLYGVGEYFLD